MSGICGSLRLDGAPVAKGDLDRQLGTLAHLGPDRARGLCDGGVGLGHLGLRVTREDVFDAQPAGAPGDVLLVADLRLDNRDELAAALAIGDTALSDMPDSALLLAAYRRWGADCAQHLLGDFAFAIWDASARSLLLGRDHMGQRHLFYHQGGDVFVFATEIKGLWALAEVPRALREAGIRRRLLQDRSRPADGATLFEGVQALPGGTVMSVAADGAVTRRRYWEPQAAAEHLDRDEAYYRRAYRDILSEAVACRLRRATRPAALFLSGGFDSAAIAGLAAPALSGRRLIAVASVAAEDARETEASARRWVDLCRRDMPHLDLRYVTREGASVFDILDRRLLALDGQPSPNAYVTDEMCRVAAASGARVLLDGFGGDYTLNPRAYAALARLLATGQIRRFFTEFAAQRRRRPESLWRSVKRDILLPLLPRGVHRALARRRSGLGLFGSIHPVEAEFARAGPADESASPARGAPPHATQLRAISLKVLCDIQDNPTLGGVLPGAHGLELTQPFHDKRVVELALAIPEDLYFKGGQPRYLARTALADVYPPEFQSRPLGNTPLIPDFTAMVRRHQARILSDIDRMEKNRKLTRYFDFPKMRRMLAAPPPGETIPEFSVRVRQATRSFLCARYIEWFLRDNA